MKGCGQQVETQVVQKVPLSVNKRLNEATSVTPSAAAKRVSQTATAKSTFTEVTAFPE